MKPLIAAVLALLVLAPHASAQPDPKIRTWVDPRIGGYQYIKNEIISELRRDDGITVHVYYAGPAHMVENRTHIIAFIGEDFERSLQVYGGTDWPDHKTAVALLAKSEGSGDVVNRIIRFIQDVHIWQKDHPHD